MGKPIKCCGNCFGDHFLIERIASTSKETGKCDYCETEDAALVGPAELADWLWLIIDIYAPDDSGKTLIEWLKEDWDLFHHPKMDNYRAKDLLAHILTNFDIVRKGFSPVGTYAKDGAEQWEQLRNELMYNNRYFPRFRLDDTLKKEHLEQLKARDFPKLWYRARLQTSEAPFDVKDMGPPPRRLASHGRANPAGIPYLYLGSTPETAASEVRPHTGEMACVADFTLPQNLKIIDLRNPRRDVSPFRLESADQIGQLRSNISLLERLGMELTTPILPQGAPIDYVPSQYLCEFIKNCDYDGVIYKSSVSDGMNLALFAPERATSGTVRQYSIAKVSVTVSEKA